MRIIGLTGGSGSGKSVVASLLAKRQFQIIDCDQLARAVLRPETTCLSDIFRIFGQTVKNEDGSLNRAALAAIVFGDQAKLEQLNGIMYPAIIKEIEEELAELSAKGVSYAVLDAPTLFESGADRLCDQTVSVLSEEALQIRRIMERDRLTLPQAKSRLAAQQTNAFYQERSDYTIQNSGSLKALEAQVEKLIEALEKQDNK